MVLKIKKDLIYIIFMILAFLLMFRNEFRTLETILFFLNVFLAFIIIGIAQFSIFSIIVGLSNYMLANVYMVYRNGYGYGLLAMTDHIYMREMNFLLLIFNISILFWILNGSILKRENKFLKCDLNFSKQVCIVSAIVAMIFAFIAWPSFQFGLTENRFQALLPGHFWNHFMIVFMIISVSKIKESHVVKFCIVCIIVWALMHGERVDVVGFLAFLFVKYCVKKNYRLNITFFVRFAAIFILFFAILISIGETRVGGTTSIAFVFNSFLSQGTASDVGYVFNSAIDYIKNYPLLMGKTYITYVQGILPFFEQPLKAGLIIQDIYRTAGGEYILVEPLINYGYFGTFCFINIYMAVVWLFLKRISSYKVIVFMFLLATAFRYIWYGFTYIETGLLYLIPCAYVFVLVVGKRPQCIIDEGKKDDK